VSAASTTTVHGNLPPYRRVNSRCCRATACLPEDRANASSDGKPGTPDKPSAAASCSALAGSTARRKPRVVQMFAARVGEGTSGLVNRPPLPAREGVIMPQPCCRSGAARRQSCPPPTSPPAAVMSRHATLTNRNRPAQVLYAERRVLRMARQRRQSNVAEKSQEY